MIRPFQLVAPDRLQLREGGGCLALFGVPFFAAGVFLILNGVGVIRLANASELPPPGPGLLFLMGLPFTAVGATLTLGRTWTTIDRSRRRVIKQYGLLMPLYEKAVPLQEATAVTLGFVAGDSDTDDSFPVAVRSRTAADVPLCRFKTYAQAREYARAAAEHLDLEFEDASTDHPVRMPPNQMADPLPVRLRREPMQSDAARPAGARSDVTRGADGMTITVPARRLHPAVLAATVIPLAIPFAFGVPVATFFKRSQTPDPIAWVFLGFLALFFGVLPLTMILNAFLRSRRGATIVTVSKQEVRIQERGAWTTRTVATLDPSDILDVDYSSRESTIASAKRAAEQQAMRSSPNADATVSPRLERFLAAITRFAGGKGITIKTRTGLTAFGQGLDDAEVRYLHDLVRRELIG